MNDCTEYNEKTLYTALQAGKRSSIYLLIGSDSYLLERCIALLVRMLDAEKLRFDLLKVSDEALEEPFYFGSLLGGERLLLLENFMSGSFPEARIDLLVQLLSAVPDGLTVVLLSPRADEKSVSVSKKMKEFLSRLSNSCVVVLRSKQGRDLITAVRALAKEEGCEMDEDAAVYLTELCGGEMQALAGEVKKAAGFCGYSRIDKNTIEATATRSLETNVFDMIRALEKGSTSKALALLQRMLLTKTEPLSIAGAMNSSFLNLLRAKFAAQQGLSVDQARELYGFSKSNRQLAVGFSRHRKYSMRQLSEIVGLLSELDLDLKTAGEKGLILEEALVRLSGMIQER